MAIKKVVYCIDSSVLMHVQRRYTPRHLHRAPWEFLNNLVTEGRLVAPDEVLYEAEKGTDDLAVWIKRHRDMLVPVDADLVRLLQELETDGLGEIIAADKPSGVDADPMIVAVARRINLTPDTLFETTVCVVLSMEKSREEKLKIPDACAHYGIECIDWDEFMEREGLRWDPP